MCARQSYLTVSKSGFLEQSRRTSFRLRPVDASASRFYKCDLSQSDKPFRVVPVVMV